MNLHKTLVEIDIKTKNINKVSFSMILRYDHFAVIITF